MPDVAYNTCEDFLKRMDAGDFDSGLHIELKKLTKQQLWQLALILLERSKKQQSDT